MKIITKLYKPVMAFFIDYCYIFSYQTDWSD